MKKLADCALAHINGAAVLSSEAISSLVPQVNWDDFSPDVRFSGHNAYKKPFDLAKCFKALAHGQTYTYDLLSENGCYVLEMEISFGQAPLSNTNDFTCHLGVSVPA